MDRKEIGNRLRELRGDKSRSKVCEDLKITKSSWAMYERGERVPRDEIKVKIANYFNVPVTYIFFAE